MAVQWKRVFVSEPDEALAAGEIPLHVRKGRIS
jgi:hypothetical protein